MMASSARLFGRLPHLIPLVLQQPGELCDRVRAKLECHVDRRRAQRYRYTPATLRDGLTSLALELGIPLDETLAEESFAEMRAHVTAGIAGLERGPFSAAHNGDLALASVVYYAARALRPSVAIETGVAYGVTSVFLLQALARNGQGKLCSIDLPPLGPDAQAHVGALVPEELRSRWHLHRGVSRRRLTGILHEVGSVDLFIHDSLHTYANMRWEFETVWPFLRRGGLLIADDIEDNAAFGEFAEEVTPAAALVIQEQGKHSLLGVLRKP